MSVTQARKERERTAREELIVDHAQRLLLRDGYQNLNLDELAKAIEYSKGTIYLHFQTKEDLVLAVSTRALKERADLFERATQFTGSTRERIRAIGFACCQFAIAYQDYFKVEMMLKSTSFWEKATEGRRHQHHLQEGRCFRALSGIVQEALHRGDIISNEIRAEHITFSLIAMTVGSHIMSAEPGLQILCGIDNPIGAVRRNQDLICDGLGWKPLAKDWDYAATDRRIHKELFPEAKWLNAA